MRNIADTTVGRKPQRPSEAQPNYWQAKYLLQNHYPDDDEKTLTLRLYHHYRKVRDVFFTVRSSWLAVEEVAKKLLLRSHVGKDEFLAIMEQINPPKIKGKTKMNR